MIGRRGFITGLISLAAAPAIVRAGSLMPVKVMEPQGIVYRDPYRLAEWVDEPWGHGPLMNAIPTLQDWSTEMARAAARFQSNPIILGSREYVDLIRRYTA